MNGGLRTTGAAPRQSEPGAPLVSIVTVVFNGAEHIEQAITSVLGQSYRNFEYIVVDGGSTDGTLDIIRRYEDRIDFWVSEADSGIYNAMNKGLRLAQGELIGLLNADDFYEPDALEKTVAAYLEKRTEGIYYGNNYVLQEDLSLKYRNHASLRYWLGMSICHQAMFVHRDVYRELGGYREDFRFAADYDFLLRAAAAKVTMVHVEAYLVNYRDTGLTSRYYVASLAEAKQINRGSFGRFSRRHAAYLASYYKTMILHVLQQVVLQMCGRQALDRLRTFYLRKVLLKDGDIID
ncbi:MAG TPA: glycosyltransferase family 2 protein [Desulfuromonadales bacterium]|nr:glycosyltransferase family 2 protein [Desulfuromonadales bacterium]